MKLGKIITLASLATVLLIGISILLMYFHYLNVNEQNKLVVQGKISQRESVFDEMFKVIAQKAEVSNQYKKAFSEIYPDLISGRYENGNGQLMQWIQESNPNFDVSLYKDLMRSIEGLRAKFNNIQTELIAADLEQKKLLRTVPSKWFLDKNDTIPFEIISSTYAKDVSKTGIDDDIVLFD